MIKGVEQYLRLVDSKQPKYVGRMVDGIIYHFCTDLYSTSMAKSVAFFSRSGISKTSKTHIKLTVIKVDGPASSSERLTTDYALRLSQVFMPS